MSDRTEAFKKIHAEIAEHGIETIRVMFVDQHGILRGKTIVADAFPSACENGIGVPSTLLLKDTSHRTVFPVWQPGVAIGELPLGGAGDVLLRPNPAHFYRLPWAPQSALILSEVHHRTGAPISFSSSAVLGSAIKSLDEIGYKATFGLEVEFQIFERLDPALDHERSTMPPAPVATRNLTQGHQYLTETRYAEVEPLLDELRRMAQFIGLDPRSVEIEMGPSQFEFTFGPADPETQAARFVLFRTLVKEVCHHRGLHATFMAKPGLPNAAANGWHIHQSLIETTTNRAVFSSESADLTPEASAWIAGLLEHATASCLLTNPTVNSYKRFSAYQLAPNCIQWGRDNRGAMVRALCDPGSAASRVENRVPDTSANPYFAFAAQIAAGTNGLQRKLAAPPATEVPYNDAACRLPTNLGAAIAAFAEDMFIVETFGADFQKYLKTLKQAEWDRYLMTVSDWEQQEYFGLF